MKVFVTGASGFIGSATVRELLAAGHQVVGLARSAESAASIAAAGAEVQLGTLDDLDTLRSAAAAAEGVIHTAYVHNFTDFEATIATDRQVVETLIEVLAGSGRPFVMASGVAGLAPGRVATEEDMAPVITGRRATEVAALAASERNVRVAAVRLPSAVHGEGDQHGFIPGLIKVAREKGISAYIDEGSNRWASVHRLDAAHLFRLALESAPAGTPWHAVADEGVLTRDIAAAIGRQLNVPVVSIPADKAIEHFGWLGNFFKMDIQASSALTQQRLGWQPAHPDLLSDIEERHYFASLL